MMKKQAFVENSFSSNLLTAFPERDEVIGDRKKHEKDSRDWRYRPDWIRADDESTKGIRQ
jgi:hypothetical protein